MPYTILNGGYLKSHYTTYNRVVCASFLLVEVDTALHGGRKNFDYNIKILRFV
jgi:hypothetical protein